MTTITQPLLTLRPKPAWVAARPLAEHSDWSEDEYLAYDGNRLVEFLEGTVEVLPMPSFAHQLILQRLFRLLDDWVLAHELGTVVVAPFPVRVFAKRYREPDIALLGHRHLEQEPDRYLQGAELAIEIVSPDDPKRDYEDKRLDYAEAGIPEYWIVDPRTKVITVLMLRGHEYVELGLFNEGDVIESVVVAGFKVDVSQVFSTADGEVELETEVVTFHTTCRV